MTDLSEVEWDFRVRRYQQLREQCAEELPGEIAEAKAERAEDRPELDEIISQFRSSRDVHQFREAMDSWSRGKPRYGFAGQNGAMFLNQLVKDGDAATVTSLLLRIIDMPETESSARGLADELATYVTQLRKEGSAAALGRIGPLLSWFWWLDQPDVWPVQWTSAKRVLDQLGFLDDSGTPWDRYLHYRAHVHRFGSSEEVERVLALTEEHQAYGLDPATANRLTRIRDANSPADDPQQYEANKASIDLLRKTVRTLGAAMEEEVSAALGKRVKRHVAGTYWAPHKKVLREDVWVTWVPQTSHPTPSLVLAADKYGAVKIGFRSNPMRKGHKGLADRMLELLSDHRAPGCDWMTFGPVDEWSQDSKARDPAEIPTWAILGRRFELADMGSHEQVKGAVLDTAAALQPAFEAAWRAESGMESIATTPQSHDPGTTDEANPKLANLLQQFLGETDYPNERDLADKMAQREWAKMLEVEQLPSIALSELRRIYGGGTYGSPGPQSNLHTTLADEDPAVIDRFLSAISFLLWGEGDVAGRIDRVMDESDLGLRGFKESAIMKLLAVARPDEFLAVFPFTGDSGKAAVMQTLGLPVPPMTDTVGTRQQEASATLKSVVEPLLPGDSWGQSRFLYWLHSQPSEADITLDTGEIIHDEDQIEAVAEKLSLPREFLDEIVELLENHRQLIFYGPPGTGKTYVAQHLAEAITATDEQRRLIQFHPSTSYEDFFEGYRPLTTSDERIVYKLVGGPLRLMAERATADLSGKPYILIIDEINRANLAKVLGELLFLLEYRDTEINPLYRPDEPFSLPKNLWIIGTMNTADRSIATVDAALRRRFHFVPFVPDDRDDNPISELLRRWLADNEEPEWVADLVDGVNQRLRGELGGDHLLLGPSYFMTSGLDKDALAQIWKYRIEPLIDDLFFGEDKAKAFRFARVWSDFGPQDESDQ